MSNIRGLDICELPMVYMCSPFGQCSLGLEVLVFEFQAETDYMSKMLFICADSSTARLL